MVCLQSYLEFHKSNSQNLADYYLLSQSNVSDTPCVSGNVKNEGGFLTKESRVTVYCTSYELLFTCESQVTIYFRSYKLLFTYDLRVITYCTSYGLLYSLHKLNVSLSYELRVTIYCTSWDYNVDYVTFLYQIPTKCSLQNQVFLVSYSWAMYFINECSNVKL